jgi:flotillin
MEKKAEAWRKYGEAAVLQIVAPILPEIARAVADPLSKIDRITLVNTGNGSGGDGVSRITGEVAKVIAQVPPVLESLTGMKFDQLFDKVRGFRPTGAPDVVIEEGPVARIQADGGDGDGSPVQTKG